jgi:flagellar motor protein MotB
MEQSKRPTANPLFAGILFVLMMAMMQLPPYARAQESTDVDDEMPAFSNPTQAMRAENLAALSASEPDEEAQEAVAEAMQKEQILEAKKTAYETLLNDPNATPEQIAAAKAAMDAAQTDFDQAQAAAEEKMAAFAGVSVDEIAVMRSQDMGWGVIARELGIHPSALGMGHIKRNRFGQEELDPDAEIQMATQRNTKTGWAKGHGQGQGSAGGNSGGGKGQGGQKAKKDKGSGNKGGSGKGGKK